MSKQDMSQQSSSDNSAEKKAKPSWFKRLLKLMAIGALLGVVLLVAGGLGFKHWLTNWSNTPNEQRQLTQFVVNRGDSASKVLRNLQNSQIIEEQWRYKALFVFEPQLTRLKAGHYEIPSQASPRELLTVLASGVEKQFAITFIEGTTFKEWLGVLQKHPQVDYSQVRMNDYIASFPASSVDEDKYRFARVEGMFYPDTYHFTANTKAIDLLKRAHSVLNSTLDELWKTRVKDLPLDSKEEALVLASIIEKESGFSAERRDVASVFINRLNKKMRLQTDPTVIYGMADVYDGDIKYSHLRDKNVYNTYVIKRLPPTPIAMVSRQAIAATLNPTSTPYLYFVASGKGDHVFSTNLKDHNRALKRYLATLKQQ
ncbi:endolytic transglycosylase MltG [Psychrobium sp. MM17-31]|uniref:endolytic transglycosylase MltG n=1 Tax=Psychrobium sp. MM17-31 TaxID=2917758 RepID=UPI001EF65CE6|nr:endolytic transglycosylase MltG [Psychrobium sp. MM17-31]MCG7531530.1 endolytic transglycosylase MltG [Psychrobium sp. MM17-31]